MKNIVKKWHTYDDGKSETRWVGNPYQKPVKRSPSKAVPSKNKPTKEDNKNGNK